MEIQEEKKKLKLLFFHNTLPEYRIGWFQCLAQEADVDFVFTNEMQNKKDYGFDIDYEKSANLKCTFLSDKKKGFDELSDILKNIENYDFVELPPIDSIREVIYSVYITYRCKKKNIKLGYFWEKWEAPQEKQPLKRKIKNYILRIVPRCIYKKADIIFSVGKKNKEYFLLNGVKENRIKWIPDVSETPVCEYENIRKKYNISEKKIILYLGRVMQQKGVRYLIKAYSMIPIETRKEMHLIIAGDGDDLRTCQKLASNLRIDSITFTGRVNPSIRGNYFSQCDVFVYPVTYYKGRVDVWGLSINEAIQHGKTVIATNAVGSAYELIENNVNGFIINAMDEKNMAYEIAKGIEKCDEKMKKKSKIYDRKLAEKYSFYNMAKIYLAEIMAIYNYTSFQE